MTSDERRLYIWLDGEPGVTPHSVAIHDEPGVNDLDQLADAIRAGALGRYLPVTLHVAEHADPNQRSVRAVDVAKLLRDRNLRHRRRYEVILEAMGADDTLEIDRARNKEASLGSSE